MEHEFEFQAPQQTEGYSSTGGELFWLAIKTIFVVCFILFAIKYAIKQGKEGKPDKPKEEKLEDSEE